MKLSGIPSKKRLQRDAEDYAARARVREMNAKTASGRGNPDKATYEARRGRYLWKLARIFSRWASQTPEDGSND